MYTREETAGDYPAIRTLVETGFKTAHYSEGDEQDFVERMRACDTYVPALSLVVENDDELIAHIMLTRLSLHTSTQELPVLYLAIVTVAEHYRNQGIGTALVHEALNRAQALGHQAIFVLGDPAFYGRFGFVSASVFGISHGNGFDDTNVMALELAFGGLANGPANLILPQ